MSYIEGRASSEVARLCQVRERDVQQIELEYTPGLYRAAEFYLQGRGAAPGPDAAIDFIGSETPSDTKKVFELLEDQMEQEFEAFWLCHMELIPVVEAARRLGIGFDEVKRILRRYKAKYRRRVEAYRTLDIGPIAGDLGPFVAAPPEAEVDRTRLREWLRKLINNLPDLRRRAIEGKFFQQLSDKEILEQCEALTHPSTPSSVRNARSVGLAQLGDLIMKEPALVALLADLRLVDAEEPENGED